LNFLVSKRIEDIDKKLDAEVYTTKTRGERHISGARPVAEGVYALVRYHDHVHLGYSPLFSSLNVSAYVLELPDEPNEVQKAFNIGKEGSFVLQVKNPEVKGISMLGDKTGTFYSQ
jgi:hypothetical protein